MKSAIIRFVDKSILILIVALIFFISSSVSAADATITVFVNVNVIPMDKEQVLENQSVVIKDDRIIAIGSANEVVVPEGAKTIDANGAYLMPGLSDMHMHFSSLGRTFEGPDQLRVFLAEGVTTVRSFNGLPEYLFWRDEIVQGKRIGPTIYTSGPLVIGLPDDLGSMRYTFWGILMAFPVVIGLLIWLLLWCGFRLTGKSLQFRRVKRYILPSLFALLLIGGLAAWLKFIPLNAYTSRSFPFATVPETVSEARKAVQDQKAAGYDFIKVYDYLGDDEYLAVLDEAQKQKIYVVGHLLDSLSPKTIFDKGLKESAHMDEFMESHMIGKASPTSGFNGVTFNYDTIPESVSAVKSNNGMVVSNMVTDEVIYEILEDVEKGLAQPQYKIVPPKVIDIWKTRGRFVNWQGQHEWRKNVQMPFLIELTKSLHDGAVPLLIGTDMSVEGMVPAHIHRELELLVKAGLTPYEALEAGTKNAGMSVKRMGDDGKFGTVEVGQRADLILLEKNPLENISNTRKRVGVMARGKWFTQAELEKLVDDFVTTYK